MVVTFILYSLQTRNAAITENTIPIITSPTPENTPTDTISVQPSRVTTTAPNVTSSPVPTNTPKPKTGFQDGQFTGNAADAFYGYIQVKVTIQQGKISDVQFLQYPNDRRQSVEINTQAMPYLKQEAIQAQNANVDIVSGATDSSRAFIESLSSALSQAKNI